VWLFKLRPSLFTLLFGRDDQGKFRGVGGMSILTPYSWQEVVFEHIVVDSAFGPRFPGTAYADDGNIATLRTTDISADGYISYGTMPLAQLDEATFAKHFLRPGDLVITRSGRIGTTAIFEGHENLVLPGAFLIRFRLSKKANPRFFRYWFNSSLGQQRLLSVARGAAQQNINIRTYALTN
jgi:type I restriction enzyme S subunit